MANSYDDEIVEATSREIIRVIEQMVDLPWPPGDGQWVEWQIDGLEGQSSYLAHVLPLAGSDDCEAVAALLADVCRAADRHWGTPRSFEATRFSDTAGDNPSDYDPRRSAAKLIRAIGASTVPLWEFGDHDVVLADGSVADDGSRGAVVFVFPHALLTTGRAQRARPRADPIDRKTLAAARENETLAKLISRDPSRITSAAWGIIATRDPEVLAPLAASRLAIGQATEDVALGGALASNHLHLRHALERLELFEQRTCLCAAYPHHLFYEPEKEEHRGHARIIEVVPVFHNGRRDRPRRICECADCGQRFSVEEGESHYTWWQWTRL